MKTIAIDEASLVKTESKAERNACLAAISNDRACEILNKTKSLFFAFWQGVGIVTTEKVAEFYEVPASSVRQASIRLREELMSDGLKTARGKDLSDARDILSQASRSSQMVLWTPRSVLRLGMVLKASEIAKQVRTSLLDVAQQVATTTVEVVTVPVHEKEVAQASVDKFMDAMAKSQTIAQSILAPLGINPVILAQYQVNALAQACPDEAALLAPAKALLLNAAPQEAQDLTPTELAAQLGEKVGPRQVNTALESLGLQVKINDGKRNIWQLTDKGKEYGQVYLATGDSNQWSGGQIRWNPKVLKLLKTVL